MKLKLELSINNNLYIRDPEQTKLGQDIVRNSIILIHDLGFENFTFKKIATEIKSNEQSIYRYFESKHQLMKYLFSWYWGWLEFRLEYHTHVLENPEDKLRMLLKVLSEAATYDPNFAHIDEVRLAEIVARVSVISYVADFIPEKNINDTLDSFKGLCNKIQYIIKEFAPNYQYPVALSYTLLRVSHEHIFISKYLSDDTGNKSSNETYDFLKSLVFSTVGLNTNEK